MCICDGKEWGWLSFLQFSRNCATLVLFLLPPFFLSCFDSLPQARATKVPRISACWAPCQQAPTFLRKELCSGWRAAGIGLPSRGLFPDRKAGLGLLGRDQSLELPLREQVPLTSCSIQPCSHRSTGWARPGGRKQQGGHPCRQSRSQARGHRKSWGGKGEPSRWHPSSRLGMCV